jgi:hypothetical protein
MPGFAKRSPALSIDFPFQTQVVLQGFFAAQGLHGLQGFFAAHGLHGLQPFFAAHGLQGLQAFAAHGLQGLHFFAAHGLQGLQEAARISGFCCAAGFTASATTTFVAETANTPPTMAAYSGLRLI